MGEQHARPPTGEPRPAVARQPVRPKPSKAAVGDDRLPAAELPVAHVLVDTPLAHLDRPFDYLVPASMSEAVVPGARVKVRFSGRLVDGFVRGRSAASEHPGRLAPLAKSVSPYPVLSPEVVALAHAVAERYAGTTADVLRLAVPPRHARVESSAALPPSAGQSPAPAVPESPTADGPAVEGATAVDDELWRPYLTGPGFVAALAAGRAPRAVWWALPGPTWPAVVASAVTATRTSGRGALVVVPDHRDADRVAAAITPHLAAEDVVTLRADAGPAERYRRYLAVRSGQARVVVGTRAAIFAPVASLGLVVVWDDGDDLHAEPRAPYPHTRDVAVLRARAERCGVLVGGFSPSAEAQAFVDAGWAKALVADRRTVRAVAPRVEAVGSDFEASRDPAARAARLPSVAMRAARDSLAAGAPVLVQVPRRGYHPSLACGHCRRPARCRHCHGPLGRWGAGATPSCGWCGRPAVGAAPVRGASVRAASVRGAPARGGLDPDVRGSGPAAWECPSCSGTTLRSSVVGDRRTAEELGRAFPGVAVRTSGRDGVLDRVPAAPALVVSTPGAEPVADAGYGAVLLLDGWALLGRPDLRAGEETLRRWCAAAALARPATEGGLVVVHADAGLAPVQALVRWDPGGFVAREAAERAELGFPPAVRMASVEGSAAAVAEALDVLRLPAGADVLGPVPIDPPVRGGGDPSSGLPGEQERERVLVRVPRQQGAALAAAMKAARGVLGTRKAQPVRIQLDPPVVA